MKLRRFDMISIMLPPGRANLDRVASSSQRAFMFSHDHTSWGSAGVLAIISICLCQLKLLTLVWECQALVLGIAFASNANGSFSGLKVEQKMGCSFSLHPFVFPSINLCSTAFGSKEGASKGTRLSHDQDSKGPGGVTWCFCEV
ncbi:hypothetical protein Nepgr_027882 [Nepenthes gracilis]|uniref:Uncharacterized protein n=1 Tax=Nepenthes gracilis TaxID=150966 RepID=A0AAD3Y3J6_NEPGR|nr:hypothetical protein Nepgr_027882 [Nepenthes gracilis]